MADYSGALRVNPKWPRLYKRDRTLLESQCGCVLFDLTQIGYVHAVKHRNFEKFPDEKADELLSYEFMDLPIEGLEDKKRRVVRLSEKTFWKSKDCRGKYLKLPVDYKNGLLMADSSNSNLVAYVFTKTTGKNTLTPLFMVKYDKLFLR